MENTMVVKHCVKRVGDDDEVGDDVGDDVGDENHNHHNHHNHVEEGVQNALRQVKIDTQQYAKRYGE